MMIKNMKLVLRNIAAVGFMTIIWILLAFTKYEQYGFGVLMIIIAVFLIVIFSYEDIRTKPDDANKEGGE